jgi:EpsI family protein
MMKAIIVMLLMLATSGFVLLDSYMANKPVTVNLDDFPLTVGEWRGISYTVEDRVKDILDTEYILSRDYVSPQGEHVFLSMVYYPDNKIGFHNPESCNTGVGMKVLEEKIVPVTIPMRAGGQKQIDLNMLVLGQDAPAKVIYYFYLTGDTMSGKYAAFRWQMMRQQMQFKRPSGAQVQLHITVRGSVEGTRDLVTRYMNALAPALLSYF